MSDPTKKGAEAPHILTEAEIADTSRYSLEPAVLHLPEVGGAVMVRPLTVKERMDLPSMRNDEGEYEPTLEAMAATFAAFVVQPEMTQAKARKFIGSLPGSAYDAVQLKIAEMVGSTEEARATRKEFRSPTD